MITYNYGEKYKINGFIYKYLGKSMDESFDIFIDKNNVLLKKSILSIHQGQDAIVRSASGLMSCKLHQISPGIFKLFEHGSYNRYSDIEIITEHPYIKTLANNISIDKIEIDGVNILDAFNLQ